MHNGCRPGGTEFYYFERKSNTALDTIQATCIFVSKKIEFDSRIVSLQPNTKVHLLHVASIQNI